MDELITGNLFAPHDCMFIVTLDEQSTTVLGDKYSTEPGTMVYSRGDIEGLSGFETAQIRIPQRIARGGDGYLPIKFAAKHMAIYIWVCEKKDDIHFSDTILYAYRPPRKNKRVRPTNVLRYSTTHAIGAASETGIFEINGDPATAIKKLRLHARRI